MEYKRRIHEVGGCQSGTYVLLGTRRRCRVPLEFSLIPFQSHQSQNAAKKQRYSGSQSHHMVEQTVTVATKLSGFLSVPAGAKGIVLFAHGSGSGRFSPRNRFVAQHLQQGRIATLLIDLLMSDEEADRRNVFDIDLLSDRVLTASTWLREDSRTKKLPLGYFGASTGAAAALQAAAHAPFDIGAIVSRGGRPDLAKRYLPQMTVPILLVVGGEDHTVIEMNEDAYRLLPGPKQLTIIPGATHLFEEPGTLEQAAAHALKWFERYLTGAT